MKSLSLKRAINAGAHRAALATALAIIFPVEIVHALPANADATITQQTYLRRLTEAQYRQSIADIFGQDIKVLGSFEPDMRVHGLLAEGTTRVSVTPGGLEQYETIARGIAAQATDQAHWGKLVGCAPDTSDKSGARCATAFFERIGRQLHRRPLQQVEIKSAVDDTLVSAKKLGNFQSGLGAALAGMMTSPDFLFRVERSAPNRGEMNGSELDAWSKASRLSFFLWNTTPDAQLLDAAARGDLETGEGLALQVDRLMNSPRFNEGVRAFFDDFLRLDGLSSLSKDTTIYPAFSASITGAAREQTLRTISALLVAERGSYLDLFTTRRFAMNRTLGPLYNVPVASKDWVIYEFPDNDPRAGLLTQFSFLALHSHPGRTSPTLRGKAVREVLMCEEIPAPPANVNFSVVQDVSNPNLRTTRERVQAHLNDEDCAGCHKKTDPIGLGLEKFDGAGQFRALENGSAIDVAGDLDKATFVGAAELGTVMSRSPAVASCLVQSTYRYAMGRAIANEEKPLISQYERTFADNAYRFVDLVRAIVLNPSFYSATTTVAESRATLNGKEKS